MRIFKADFLRTFAIGFALGAVIVFATLGDGKDTMVPSAIAAPATTE